MDSEHSSDPLGDGLEDLFGPLEDAEPEVPKENRDSELSETAAEQAQTDQDGAADTESEELHDDDQGAVENSDEETEQPVIEQSADEEEQQDVTSPASEEGTAPVEDQHEEEQAADVVPPNESEPAAADEAADLLKLIHEKISSLSDEMHSFKSEVERGLGEMRERIERYESNRSRALPAATVEAEAPTPAPLEPEVDPAAELEQQIEKLQEQLAIAEHQVSELRQAHDAAVLAAESAEKLGAAVPESAGFAEAARRKADEHSAALNEALSKCDEAEKALQKAEAELSALRGVQPEPVATAPAAISETAPVAVAPPAAVEAPSGDPFATAPVVEEHLDPFEAPPAEHDDPFAFPPADQHTDPFGTPVTHQDPFGTPVEEPHSDPFDTPAPAHDDPFAFPPADQHIDPFGGPAAHDDPFGAPISSEPAPHEDPFGAPVEEQHDPFGAPAPAHEDPFAAPVEEHADPFGAPIDEQRNDPFGAPISSEPVTHEDPFAFPAAEEHSDPFAAPAPEHDDPFGGPIGSESNSKQTDPFANSEWDDDLSGNSTISVGTGFDESDTEVAPVAAAPLSQTQIPAPVDLLYAIASVDDERASDSTMLVQAAKLRENAIATDTSKSGRSLLGGKGKKPTIEPLPFENLIPQQPMIAVFFSPSGGVGKSSSAVNFAVQCAKAAEQQAAEQQRKGIAVERLPRILVIDGDVVHGSLALRLAGRLTPSMFDLFETLDERKAALGLDTRQPNRGAWVKSYENAQNGEASIRDFMLFHESIPNLDLLAAPDDPDMFYELKAQDYHEMLAMLANFYDIIVIDSGTEVVMPSTRTWLAHAHAVMLLTSPDIDRLHNAKKQARIITTQRPDPSDRSENPRLLDPLVTRDKIAVTLVKADLAVEAGLDSPEKLLAETFETIDANQRFYINDFDRELRRANNKGEFLVLQNQEYARELNALAKFAFSRYSNTRR